MRAVRLPRFRTKETLDSFERFLIKRVERTVEHGFLFLMILKILARRPMTGGEVRRAISDAGLGFPGVTTFYSHLSVMKSMKLVSQGEDRKLHLTEKGLTVLEHAEAHLRGLVAKLYRL